ncbi:PAS domain S-box-containing protein [Mariprofundus ferrinatatus]|uniref:histidine kinase n=1 Tax=Mariprofundus ferrinatatus TaxID=1921087 RepID=A0A2K8L483_9PROT|nr:PAS domain S-box protein [Mariprofundus ferrinatatus]ATX82138.1 PAS domain S-box-containing protein [Mariprofundus ferrinatatus]
MKEIIDQLASHDLLQDIIEGVPIRIFWKDRDCRYLGCNTIFAWDAGVSRPEGLVGKTDFDLMWKDQAERYHADDFSIMESGNSRLAYEEQRTTPEGETIWLRTSKVPLRGKNDEVIGILGIYEDITAEKNKQIALQNSEKTLNHIFNSLQEAYYRTDIEGRIIKVSPSAGAMMACEAEELLGQEIAQFYLHESGREQFLKELHENNGTVYNFEAQIRRVDGEIIWVSTNAHYFRNMQGDVTGVEGTIRDVTKQKQVEMDLRDIRHRYQQAQRIAHLGHWQLDLTNNALTWSEEVFLIFEITPEQFGASYEAFLDAVHPEDRDYVNTAYSDSLNNRTGFDIEHRLLLQDGRIKWVNGRCETSYAEDGTALYSTGTVLDITDRKLAEQELHQEAAFRNQLMDRASEGIAVWCSEGDEGSAKFITWNRRMQEITGYTRDEINRHGWLETIYDNETERNRARDTMQSVIAGNPNFGKDFEIVTKSGERRTVHISSSAIYQEECTPCVLALIQDVTEHRVQQRLLSDERKRFKMLFESSSDGIFILDMHGHFIDINRTAHERLGYSKDEMMAMSIRELDPPEFAARVPERIAMIKKHGAATFETAHYRKDGSIMPVEINSRIIELDGEPVFYSVLRDISDRKKAEEELQLAKFVMDHAPVNITFIDSDARIRYLNGTGCETLGYSQEEALNLCIPDIDPLFPIEIWGEHWADLKARKSLIVETQHQRKSGEIFPIEVMANYMEFGDKAYNVAFDRDISDRKLAEAAMQRFRVALDNSADAIFIIDRSSMMFIDMNEAACNRMGYTRQELLAMGPGDITPYLSREQLEASFDQMFRDGSDSSTIDTVHACKDGSEFPVEVRLRSFKEDGRELLVAIARDVSDRKDLEEQLRHSQKMEAVGTLVGGIAHDFNNMLAAIQGNVYLAKMQLRDHPQLGDRLRNIEKLGNRAAEMVQQLLTFARKDSVTKRVFSLNPFMKEGFKLAKTLIPENIDHQTSICSEPLRIEGDATQLQQVLMNLLTNAVDAVAEVPNPAIQCSLTPFCADPAFLKKHPTLTGNRFACISVADNGHGIPEDQLSNIFEPFYTTKEVGKGTGLGLAMLYGAVQTHDGAIEVESKVNGGSLFRIFLPLSKQKSEPSAVSKADVMDGAGRTILIADDDKDVRQTTCEVLRSLGYRIIEAEDGESALNLFRKHRSEIDLIISDVVMPKIGGAVLLEAVRQINAELPVILVTGYDRDHVLNEDAQMDFCRVVNKPFDIDLLSHTVQELLAADRN